MLKKIIEFIKYNNFFLLILAFIFISGSAVFAAGNTGAIGEIETRVEGIDNTLLLSADLDNMDMDFKIERIEQDGIYYYITYTYLDLDIVKDAWQYEIKERSRKVTKARIEGDISEFIIQEFRKIYEARIFELKISQEQAKTDGGTRRVEVAEYSGLIGKALNMAAGIFPGYEPVKITELPSPTPLTHLRATSSEESVNSKPDNLQKIYEEYVSTHDLGFLKQGVADPSGGSVNADNASGTPAESEVLVEDDNTEEVGEVKIVDPDGTSNPVNDNGIQ